MTRLVADRYRLDAFPVGRGGMGEVWFGRDTRLDRPVAVKFVRFPDDVHREELIRRFVRESRITAGIEHPGVPAVYDVGTDDGRPYMVMQQVRGVSVADLVAENGPLPLGWAAAIAAQVCAVLTAAHAASLVHRDLKPGNLMLGPDGVVRVLDFGLAAALASGDSRITRSGETLGTPAYMAPELVMAGRTEPRTDLYALGATLHEMITGRPPFSGETAYSVMHQQVDGRVPDTRSRRPEVPAELAALVRSMLAKSPDDRPTSAAEAFTALTRHVHDLRTLRGVVDTSDPEPARMQALVVARIPVEGSLSAPDPVEQRIPAALSDASGRRAQLRRLRAQVESLVVESRRPRAVELLDDAVPSAARVLGDTDPDVVDLRARLADLLFDGGDFRRAGDVYARLLAAGAGAVPIEETRRWRRQEATCLALTGDTALALSRLTALLDHEQADHGAADDRVVDLRKQLGLLQLGHGDADAATVTFAALRSDVERDRGVDAPEVHALRELERTASRSRGRPA